MFYKKAVIRRQILVEKILSSNLDVTISVLRKLIPEKEEVYVNVNHNSLRDTEVLMENKSTYLKELEQLKALVDGGVLTQEEFASKKKQLLGL